MGKVHGSLARAGKVKSQTPKVWSHYKMKRGTGKATDTDVALGCKLNELAVWKHIRKCIAMEQYADEDGFQGWASREEEDPQGPCEEENNIHSPIR